MRIEDGRLALLTSYGSEIDSAPVAAVRAGRPWFAKPDEAVATVNGTRYRLRLHKDGDAEREGDGTSEESGRFLAALRRAAGRLLKPFTGSLCEAEEPTGRRDGGRVGRATRPTHGSP